MIELRTAQKLFLEKADQQIQKYHERYIVPICQRDPNFPIQQRADSRDDRT